MTPCVASSTPQPHHHHLSHTIAIYPSTPFPLANKRLHPSLNTSLYLHPSLNTSLYIDAFHNSSSRICTEGPGPDFPHMHARIHTLCTLAAPCLITESTNAFLSHPKPLSIQLAPCHGSTALILKAINPRPHRSPCQCTAGE